MTNDPKNDVMPLDDEGNEIIGEGRKSDSISPSDDEIIPEDTGKPEAAIAALREKLHAAEKKAAEYLDGWQRLKADSVNVSRRRNEEEKERMRFANEELIVMLIPVLQSFDSAKADKVAWETIDKNWRLGIEYIESQLRKTLSDFGLTELSPEVGMSYIPSLHEAISFEEVANEAENHKIISVSRKGYALYDKIIRAPQVVVGEYKRKAS